MQRTSLDSFKSRNKLTSSDVIRNDPNFAGFTLNGEIKQGSITQCFSKHLEDMAKEHLDLTSIQNEEGYFNHNMESLSWYSADEISIQCLRTLPNRDEILKNGVFIEAVRCILGLPSHILQPTWYYGKLCNAYQWRIPSYARKPSKSYY